MTTATITTSILAAAAEQLGRPIGYALWGSPSCAHDLRHPRREGGDAYVAVHPDGTVTGQSRSEVSGWVTHPPIRSTWTSADMVHLWRADPEAAALVERLADEWYDAHPAIDPARIRQIEDERPPLCPFRSAYLFGGGAVSEVRGKFPAPIGDDLGAAGRIHAALVAPATADVRAAREALQGASVPA